MSSEFLDRSLCGRVALVTGGLRGIGRATVRRLLDEGASVIVSDLDSAGSDAVAEQMSELGDNATYLQLNVADEEQWETAASFISQRFSRLDILVNNAGVGCVGAVETLSMDAWRRVMSINVDGVFLGVKHMTRLLSDTGKKTPAGSAVVNVSSIMGLVGYSEASAYNAGKGAVRLFTKATAIEFAQKRMAIRVNSVHPGFVEISTVKAGLKSLVDGGMAPDVPELIKQLSEVTPLGRFARPEEVAAAIYFLSSDESSYCTGSELVIDGGWTAQ